MLEKAIRLAAWLANLIALARIGYNLTGLDERSRMAASFVSKIYPMRETYALLLVPLLVNMLILALVPWRSLQGFRPLVCLALIALNGVAILLLDYYYGMGIFGKIVDVIK